LNQEERDGARPRRKWKYHAIEHTDLFGIAGAMKRAENTTHDNSREIPPIILAGLVPAIYILSSAMACPTPSTSYYRGDVP
jgi:hypothetical protein